MPAAIQLGRRFSACESGATGGEYAMLFGLLVLTAIAAISAFGGLAHVAGGLSGAILQPGHDGPSAASLPLVTQSD